MLESGDSDPLVGTGLACIWCPVLNPQQHIKPDPVAQTCKHSRRMEDPKFKALSSFIVSLKLDWDTWFPIWKKKGEKKDKGGRETEKKRQNTNLPMYNLIRNKNDNKYWPFMEYSAC